MTPNDSLPPPPDAAAGAAAALNLRPLPLGELLDRAFHLYFRNIAAFSALLAIVLVPSIIVTYLQSAPFLNFYMTMIQHQIQSPKSAPDLSTLSALAPSDALTALQLALAIVVLPIAYGAVVVGVSRAYLGLPVHFADSYRYALRRWLHIIILIAMWIVAFVVAALAMVIVGGIVAAIVIPTSIALGRLIGGGTFFGIVTIIFFIAAMLALFCLIIMLYMTSAMSFIAVVLERVDPVKAFGTAFVRMFGARQFWRGFVLALALSGIYLGASLLAGGGGAVLAYTFKAPALYVIAGGLLQLFFFPFAVVTAAVFYYDIRIRREGYDLQMLIDRFSEATPAI